MFLINTIDPYYDMSKQQYRSEVEKDADDVGNMVYSLRDKISDIEKIVADEANRIKSFKASKGSS